MIKWSIEMFKTLFTSSPTEAFIFRYKTTGIQIPDEYMTEEVKSRLDMNKGFVGDVLPMTEIVDVEIKEPEKHTGSKETQSGNELGHIPVPKVSPKIRKKPNKK